MALISSSAGFLKSSQRLAAFPLIFSPSAAVYFLPGLFTTSSTWATGPACWRETVTTRWMTTSGTMWSLRETLPTHTLLKSTPSRSPKMSTGPKTSTLKVPHRKKHNHKSTVLSLILSSLPEYENGITPSNFVSLQVTCLLEVWDPTCTRISLNLWCPGRASRAAWHQ